MSSNFTEDKLIACLQSKQKYKGVVTFIQQACKFNEEIYTVINGALVRTLLAKKSNCMTKLFALRFFKQLLLTGNFTMIDSLDEAIEDYIMEIAQYNIKSKQSRGANYFVDLYQVKKEEEIVKLGISYVVLATEIIGVTSKMYPVDENGDETRFVKYFKKLTKLGLSLDFNKCNYFKKEDVETFHRNYRKWLEWCEANYQEEEPENDLNINDKSKLEQSSQPVEVAVIKKQQPKEMINLKNVSLLNSKPSENQVESANALNLKQPQDLNQSALGPFPNLSFSTTNQMNLLTHSIKTKPNWEQERKLLQNELNIQKKLVDDMHKKKIDQQRRYQQQINLLKKHNQQYTVQIQNLKVKIAVLDKTVLKLQTELKQKQIQLKKAINQLPTDEPQKSKRDKNVMQTECFKIIVSAPKNIDLLEEQNEVLKQALQKCSKENYESEQLLKRQNQKLKDLLQQKQQVIVSLYKLQQDSQQHIRGKDSSNNVSLPIDQQANMERIQKCDSQRSKFVNAQIDNRSQQKNNLQTHQRTNSANRNTNNCHQRPRTLKKTQSQQRLNNMDSRQIKLSNTAVQFFNYNQKSNPAAKLLKTSHNFTLYFQHNVPKLITTFPYLEDYFPKLPEECQRFKEHCLLVSDVSDKAFYENSLIKASLKILSFERYVVVIANLTNTQKKVKLMTANQCIILSGQKTKKIAVGSACQFEIAANNINFNLRFPIVNVVVGSSGLNLTNSSPANQIFQIYLPITLLNYCRFQKIEKEIRCFQTKTLKYTTNNFKLNTKYKNIRECFALLDFSIESRDIVYRGIVEFRYLSDAKLILEMRQSNRSVVITTEFQQFSSNSCSLAKVLLQIIGYLTKVQ